MRKTCQAKGLRSSRLKNACPTIGVLTHGFADSLVLPRIVEAARQLGVRLIGFAGGMLGSPHGFEAQANRVFDLVNPSALDGLIVDFDTLCHYVGIPALREFCARYPLPMVSNGVALPGIPGVRLDFAQGMRAVIAHLIEAHHCRRIAFIRGPASSLTGEERYLAYQQALAAYDIPFDPQLVASGTFYAPSGAEAVRLLFDERGLKPDALAAANDFMALDAMRALAARGVRIPEDVAVVGFDDMEEAWASTPPLTTVNFQIYARMHRLLELLLTMLDGEPVPEETLLPPQLVIRQSCGCPSAAIKEVAAVASLPDIEGVEMTSVDQRAALLAAIYQTVSARETEIQGIAILFDALIAESLGQSPRAFLTALKEVLRQAWTTGGDLNRWHSILSGVRRVVNPYFRSVDVLTKTEELWQQARMLLGETAERAQLAQKIQAEQQFAMVQAISQALLVTFDVAELMNILARELPRLGIPSCALALHEDPYQPTEWVRLRLAYHEHGRIPLPVEGQRLPIARFVPPECFPPDRKLPLLFESLHFQEVQLGLVVFEVGPDCQFLPRTGARSENPLRGAISSALQGALLVQRIQEHAAQIARQQYILDTFMANVPDAIYFKDAASHFISVNQAMARAFGVSVPDDLIGKTDFDLFPEPQACAKYEQEQEIIRTGQPIFALEEPNAQGRWALTTKMPLRDERGAIIGTFGISRDITTLKQTEQELRQYRTQLEELVAERTHELSRTNAHLHAEIMERRQLEEELTSSNTRLHEEILERRRTEQALRASEQQYRTLAESVTDGILIVQHAAVVFANQIFSRLLERSPESLDDLAGLWRLPDRQALDNWFATETTPRRQAEMMTRTGRAIWVEIEPGRIVWNGEPAILLTVRDITDRKLREQRLEDERARLQQENVSLKSTIKERYRFGDLIGKSAAMQQVYERIINAASADVNVLVCGESGVGKELIARMLHQISLRQTQAFIPVNCASIPETLFEREFFGHRKGSFTGADRNTPGFFDRAHQGVLFLDEVTELTPGMQAKLLRVLQDGEYFPVGSNTPKQANVLIVAATNKEPQIEIQQGRLRKDFFYRICVILIDVPPLRERKDDLPLLIEAILEQSRLRQTAMRGQTPPDFPINQTMLPTELVLALYQYAWPGNVRELQNVLQRYVATGDLSAVLPTLGDSVQMRSPSLTAEDVSKNLKLPDAVEALEKRMIADALTQTGYHIGKTVELLGLPRRTLERKLKHYQLQRMHTPK